MYTVAHLWQTFIFSYLISSRDCKYAVFKFCKLRWNEDVETRNRFLYLRRAIRKLDLLLLHFFKVGWSQNKDRGIWFFLHLCYIICKPNSHWLSWWNNLYIILRKAAFFCLYLDYFLLKHIMASKLPENCLLLKIYLFCWDVLECSCAISDNFVWLLTIFESVLDKKKILFHIISIIIEIVPKWMIQV